MAPPNSVMSAPAMKVRPSQISTMALASDAMAALKPSNSPSRTLAESAFTGGEFKVMTATSPSWVRVVTELISVILGSLGLLRRLAHLGGRPQNSNACYRPRWTPPSQMCEGEGTGYSGARRVNQGEAPMMLDMFSLKGR